MCKHITKLKHSPNEVKDDTRLQFAYIWLRFVCGKIRIFTWIVSVFLFYLFIFFSSPSLSLGVAWAEMGKYTCYFSVASQQTGCLLILNICTLCCHECLMCIHNEWIQSLSRSRLLFYLAIRILGSGDICEIVGRRIERFSFSHFMFALNKCGFVAHTSSLCVRYRIY